MRRQQDVVALDVAVDGLVDVKVLEALRGSKREQNKSLSHDPSDVALQVCESGSHSSERQRDVTHHERFVQDVGNDAFIHPLPSLQQAFGQVCHRATVAELQQDGEKRIKMKKNQNGTKLNMSQRVLPENNPPKSRASEAAGGAKEKTTTRAYI